MDWIQQAASIVLAPDTIKEDDDIGKSSSSISSLLSSIVVLPRSADEEENLKQEPDISVDNTTPTKCTTNDVSIAIGSSSIPSLLSSIVGLHRLDDSDNNQEHNSQTQRQQQQELSSSDETTKSKSTTTVTSQPDDTSVENGSSSISCLLSSIIPLQKSGDIKNNTENNVKHTQQENEASSSKITNMESTTTIISETDDSIMTIGSSSISSLLSSIVPLHRLNEQGNDVKQEPSKGTTVRMNETMRQDLLLDQKISKRKAELARIRLQGKEKRQSDQKEKRQLIRQKDALEDKLRQALSSSYPSCTSSIVGTFLVHPQEQQGQQLQQEQQQEQQEPVMRTETEAGITVMTSKTQETRADVRGTPDTTVTSETSSGTGKEETSPVQTSAETTVVTATVSNAGGNIWDHILHDWLKEALKQTILHSRIVETQLKMTKQYFNESIMDWFSTLPKQLQEEKCLSVASMCNNLWDTDVSFRRELDSNQTWNRTQRRCICRWKMRLGEKLLQQKRKYLQKQLRSHPDSLSHMNGSTTTAATATTPTTTSSCSSSTPDSTTLARNDDNEQQQNEVSRTSSSACIPNSASNSPSMHLVKTSQRENRQKDDHVDDEDEMIILPVTLLQRDVAAKANAMKSSIATSMTASMSSNSYCSSTDEEDERHAPIEMCFSSMSLSPASARVIATSTSSSSSPVPSLLQSDTKDDDSLYDDNIILALSSNNNHGSINGNNDDHKLLSLSGIKLEVQQSKTATKKKTRAQFRMERQKALERLEASRQRSRMVASN